MVHHESAWITAHARLSALIALWVLLCTVGVTATSGQTLALPGVVVEEVGKGSAIEAAGVRPGDVLLSWRRTPNPSLEPRSASGELRSPLDWRWVDIEQAPRGTIEISGEREGKPLRFTATFDYWKTQVRPRFSARGEELYKISESQAGGLGDLAEQASRNGEWELSAWLHFKAALSSVSDGDWTTANKSLEAALQATRSPSSRSLIWQAAGTAYEEHDRRDLAEHAYKAALKEERRLGSISLVASRCLGLLSELNWDRSSMKAAEKMAQDALQISERLAPGSITVATDSNSLALAYHDLGKFEKARNYYERARTILETRAPGIALTAYTFTNLGLLAQDQGDLEAAERMFQRALALYEALESGDGDKADILNDLGSIALIKGDLQKAFELFSRAYALAKAIDPESFVVCASLSNLGIIEQDRGNFAAAEQRYREALALDEKLRPDTLSLAETLNNLGSLLDDRGDIEEAEALYRRAESITSSIAPASPIRAGLLVNLANVASARGDLDLAIEYQLRGLSVKKNAGSWTIPVALSLENLGSLTQELGDLKRAEDYYEKSLAIRKRVAPGSLAVAKSLERLGDLAADRHQWAKAESYYGQSIQIRSRQGDNGVHMASSLLGLGRVALSRKDFARALEHLHKALDVQRSAAPGSAVEADILYGIGSALRESGQPTSATQYFRQALETLDVQIDRLGGPQDAKDQFRTDYRDYYLDYIGTLLQTKKPAEAFQALENYRGKNFLAALAKRDLNLSGDGALQRRIQEIDNRYDEAQQKAAEFLAQGSPDQGNPWRIRMRELSNDRSIAIETIRKESPEYASLRYPLPLSAEEARQALDPGVLLISYSARSDGTDIFAITRDQGLRVVSLPIPREELKRLVEDFRDLVRRVTPGSPRKEALATLGRRLYQLLLSPLQDLMTASSRLLIFPDGPLHVLPWAALVQDDSQGRFLADGYNVHLGLSATLFAEQKKRRTAPDRTPVYLAAFGNPSFPQKYNQKTSVAIADSRVRSAAKRGFDFEPLPFTLDEVEQIASLFPQQAEIHLGAEATEERAKAIPESTRIVHFATHATLDERFPLNSAVVLSIPEKFEEGKDNGLLQAWEIFEKVRIDADLVVLSACESGLGKEMGGEGLIGLTRAFQYAGARSVMASLWKISDRTTAELMVRFYKHLKAGLPKDEALRAAQMELIRGPIQVKNEKGEVEEIDASAPYYWAAFQIYGDWQ